MLLFQSEPVKNPQNAMEKTGPYLDKKSVTYFVTPKPPILLIGYA